MSWHVYSYSVSFKALRIAHFHPLPVVLNYYYRRVLIPDPCFSTDNTLFTPPLGQALIVHHAVSDRHTFRGGRPMCNHLPWKLTNPCGISLLPTQVARLFASVHSVLSSLSYCVRSHCRTACGPATGISSPTHWFCNFGTMELKFGIITKETGRKTELSAYRIPLII